MYTLTLFKWFNSINSTQLSQLYSLNSTQPSQLNTMNLTQPTQLNYLDYINSPKACTQYPTSGQLWYIVTPVQAMQSPKKDQAKFYSFLFLYYLPLSTSVLATHPCQCTETNCSLQQLNIYIWNRNYRIHINFTKFLLFFIKVLT